VNNMREFNSALSAERYSLLWRRSSSSVDTAKVTAYVLQTVRNPGSAIGAWDIKVGTRNLYWCFTCYLLFRLLPPRHVVASLSLASRALLLHRLSVLMLTRVFFFQFYMLTVGVACLTLIENTKEPKPVKIRDTPETV
jgi:hypothetical protein